MAMLRNLQPNWDSYGAPAIDERCIQKAYWLWRQLSGEWQVVPCSDGGVQLEQHRDGVDVEIRVSAACAQETGTAPEPTLLDRLVTVCGACETAACWQGSFMCDHAEMAGIKNLTVRDLHQKPRGENAEYWFKDGDGKIDKTLLEIYQRLTSQNR
jgi:hypothetical protein